MIQFRARLRKQDQSEEEKRIKETSPRLPRLIAIFAFALCASRSFPAKGTFPRFSRVFIRCSCDTSRVYPRIRKSKRRARKSRIDARRERKACLSFVRIQFQACWMRARTSTHVRIRLRERILSLCVTMQRNDATKCASVGRNASTLRDLRGSLNRVSFLITEQSTRTKVTSNILLR